MCKMACWLKVLDICETRFVQKMSFSNWSVEFCFRFRVTAGSGQTRSSWPLASRNFALENAQALRVHVLHARNARAPENSSCYTHAYTNMLVTVCVHQKMFFSVNYVNYCFFLFFSGECLVSDCGEVRVPRECLTYTFCTFRTSVKPGCSKGLFICRVTWQTACYFNPESPKIRAECSYFRPFLVYCLLTFPAARGR